MNDRTTRGTALVVDDDADFRSQLHMMLEGLGFSVREAAGRAEAEADVARQVPDLVVVDLMMDEVDDGFVLSHRLKRRCPDVPVLMITGVTAATGLEFGAAQGASWVRADAMLAKPVRRAQLKETIDRLMAGREGNGHAADPGD